MRTFVYVDGFNLYYSIVRKHNARWIDLRAFLQQSFPKNELASVTYFTAIVHKSSDDAQKPRRQLAYMDALRGTGVEIVNGQFTRHKSWVKTVAGQSVQIVKVQEKGSDVNLASRLLADGFRGRYEAAIVVSNDSDLRMPIEIVRRDIGLPVVVLAPVDQPTHASQELARAASKSVLMDVPLFLSCGLPNPAPGPSGLVSKPQDWGP